jgi:hypothetical protein
MSDWTSSLLLNPKTSGWGLRAQKASSPFESVNALAVSDINFADGSQGTSGEPLTFSDAGSLGGTWNSTTSGGHRFRILEQNGVYSAIMDGRHTDNDTTWARANTSDYWDGTPEVDVFMIAVAGQDSFSPSLMRFMGSEVNFALSQNATSIENPAGTTVDGSDAVNAKDAYDLTTDLQAFLIRVPNQTIIGSGVSIGTFLGSQYPRNGRIIRFVAIPSADVADNLSNILAELEATRDTYNGV